MNDEKQIGELLKFPVSYDIYSIRDATGVKLCSIDHPSSELSDREQIQYGNWICDTLNNSQKVEAENARLRSALKAVLRTTGWRHSYQVEPDVILYEVATICREALEQTAEAKGDV